MMKKCHKESPDEKEKRISKEAMNVQDNEKSAGNNQWVTTGLQLAPDDRERRDGPGGEDADK